MKFVVNLVGALAVIAGLGLMGYAFLQLPVIKVGTDAFTIQVYLLQAIFYALAALGAFLLAILCVLIGANDIHVSNSRAIDLGHEELLAAVRQGTTPEARESALKNLKNGPPL